MSDDQKNGGRDLAYALYVLARNATAPIGDLRYIADTKLDAIDTPIAKAQIAAALGMVGDRHAPSGCMGPQSPLSPRRRTGCRGPTSAPSSAIPRRWLRLPVKATRRNRC